MNMTLLTVVMWVIFAGSAMGKETDARWKAHLDMRDYSDNSKAAMASYNEGVDGFNAIISKRSKLSNNDERKLKSYAELSESMFKKLMDISKSWTAYIRKNTDLINAEDLKQFEGFYNVLNDLVDRRQKAAEEAARREEKRAQTLKELNKQIREERAVSASERQASAQERQATAQEGMLQKIRYGF